MSSLNFALDAKRHELYKSSETNEPVTLDGSLFIRDRVSKYFIDQEFFKFYNYFLNIARDIYIFSLIYYKRFMKT